MNLSDKISNALRMLQDRGHRVEPFTLRGREWWQIDNRILATPAEIKELADDVCSLNKLTEKLNE